MKKTLGILIIVAVLGCLAFLVYLDISEHGRTEIVHYIVHIFVCIMFCTLLHDPAHKLVEWVRKLLGIKPDDHDYH